MSRFSLKASNRRRRPLDVRQLGESHEVRLARDDHVGVARIGSSAKRTLRERDRVHHQAVHLLSRFLELRDEARAHARQLLAGEQLVEVGGGATELIRGRSAGRAGPRGSAPRGH
jgi:hypothetical protein